MGRSIVDWILRRFGRRREVARCRRCRAKGTAVFPSPGADIVLCDDCVAKIVRGYFQVVRHEDPEVWDALVKLVNEP